MGLIRILSGSCRCRNQNDRKRFLTGDDWQDIGLQVAALVDEAADRLDIGRWQFQVAIKP